MAAASPKSAASKASKAAAAAPAPARPSAEIRRVADLLKQVSDPTRLQVLLLLNEKERNVSELCRPRHAEPARSEPPPCPPASRPPHRAAPLGQAQLLRPHRRWQRAGEGCPLDHLIDLAHAHFSWSHNIPIPVTDSSSVTGIFFLLECRDREDGQLLPDSPADSRGASWLRASQIPTITHYGVSAELPEHETRRDGRCHGPC